MNGGASLFVSVIITAYNEEGYIGKALDAVICQDFPKDGYEVILVDNNCTDRTVAIARTFPGVRIVKETRQGTTRARERGRMHARGAVLAFLDADSIPPPHWLSTALPWFDDPSVVGVSGPYDHYDAHALFRTVSLSFQTYCYPVAHAIVHRWLRSGSIVHGGNCFVRASALEAAGGFDADISFWGDDAEMARRLSAQGTIVFSPKVALKNSARRFAQMGTIRLLFLYWINFFWIVLFRKPYSK